MAGLTCTSPTQTHRPCFEIRVSATLGQEAEVELSLA